MRRWW